MSTLSFPKELKPGFIQIQSLNDFDSFIKENELGLEVRRSTDTTSKKTTLSFSYQPLRAEDVSALISFYHTAAGSYFNFTLEEEVYDFLPSTVITALQALNGATVWRFLKAPFIRTIITDLYLVEFTIISLDEVAQDVDASSYTLFRSFKSLYLYPVIHRLEVNEPLDTISFESLTLSSSFSSLEQGGNFLSFEPLICSSYLSPLLVLPYSYFSPLTLSSTLSSFQGASALHLDSLSLSSTLADLTYVESPPPDSVEFNPFYLNLNVNIQGFYSYMPVNIVSRLVSGSFITTNNQLHLVQSSLGLSSTTLPSSALDDTIIQFADYSGSNPESPTGFGVYPLTISAPVGETIQGLTSIVLDKENSSITLQKKGSRWTLTGIELNNTTSGGGGSSLTWDTLTTTTSPNIPVLNSFDGKVMRNGTFGSTDMFLMVPDDNTGFRDGFNCFFHNNQSGSLIIRKTTLSSTTYPLQIINSNTLNQGEMGQLFMFGGVWVFIKL